MIIPQLIVLLFDQELKDIVVVAHAQAKGRLDASQQRAKRRVAKTVDRVAVGVKL